MISPLEPLSAFCNWDLTEFSCFSKWSLWRLNSRMASSSCIRLRMKSMSSTYLWNSVCCFQLNLKLILKSLINWPWHVCFNFFVRNKSYLILKIAVFTSRLGTLQYSLLMYEKVYFRIYYKLQKGTALISNFIANFSNLEHLVLIRLLIPSETFVNWY